MKIQYQLDWSNTVTLEEHIYELFEQGRTETKEFKTFVGIFGASRIAKIWETYQCYKMNQLKKK